MTALADVGKGLPAFEASLFHFAKIQIKKTADSHFAFANELLWQSLELGPCD